MNYATLELNGTGDLLRSLIDRWGRSVDIHRAVCSGLDFSIRRDAVGIIVREAVPNLGKEDRA